MAEHEINVALESSVEDVKSSIGATGNTGGSTTAGTIFGKLNKIIADLASHISSWTSTRAGYIDRLANGTYGLDKIKADTTTNNTSSKTGILSLKLSYLISLLENTTYGLNAIKTAVSSSGGGSKVYKPSTTVLSTVLNKEVKLTSDYDSSATRYANVLYFGKFEPQYDGVIKVVASLKPGAFSDYTNVTIGVRMLVFSWDTIPVINGSTSGAHNVNLYDVLQNLEGSTAGSSNLVNIKLSLGSNNGYGSTYSKTYAYATGTTNYANTTFYIPVTAGKPIYFTSDPTSFNNDYGYLYHVMCNSIKIYATAS